MIRINLVPIRRLGPFFDHGATGVGRWVPRRPWWPLVPVLVVGAPVLVASLALDKLASRWRARHHIAT